MYQRMWKAIILLIVFHVTLQAQEVKIFDRSTQLHGWVSQGFAYTGNNNWLTMKTSSGSVAMTDMGMNASMQVTEHFRIGAQVYDRKIGDLGKFYPSLDWATASYRYKNWLGVRGGKVKSVLGLYNDTQDCEFLHTWAILPQSIYPLDLRGGTLSHMGGDIYGDIPLGNKGGTLSYTAYAGQRPEDPHGGFVLGLASIGLNMHSYDGWVQGEDLRWETPVKGLLIGASLATHHIEGNGVLTGSTEGNTFLQNALSLPVGSIEREHSKKDDYYQYYVQYVRGKLKVEGEYRREFRDEWVGYWQPNDPVMAVTFDAISDSRSWYTAASYRITKRFEVGSYFSWFVANWPADHSQPTNHVYDRDITMRFNVTHHWDVKAEGHFMNGYGAFDSIRGFYAQSNPNGLKPDTYGVVLRTGYSF